VDAATAIAIALRPVGLFVLMVLVVVPIELALKRFWPEGRLKRLLFDRTFRDRHPVYFTVVWLALMAALWTWIYLAYFRGRM
jgi:hypothetical protein